MSLSRNISVIRVRLKEIAFDHVYFGTLFTWFEVARSDIGRAAGMAYADLEKQGTGSFVTAAGATYRRPIPPGGTVKVEARIVQMGRATFKFGYSVFSGEEETPSVTGFTEHVAADFSGKPRRMPRAFSEAFAPTGEDLRCLPVEEPTETCWSTELRVRYEETDAFGVVYNGNYFAWMESAWSEHLAGGVWDIVQAKRDGREFPVIDTACRFVAPLRYDDLIRIEVESQLVSRTRIGLTYRFSFANTGQVVALGKTIHTVTENGRVIAVPPALQAALGITRTTTGKG